MTKSSVAYYRLQRIDGDSLPIELEYGDARGVIHDGDLVIQPDVMFGGDGIICIRLFGSIFGHPRIHQIFEEREAYDRLDDAYLTFPGGHRHRQSIPPRYVVRYTDHGVELTPIVRTPDGAETKYVFRGHRWTYVASEDQLPESDATAEWGEPTL